MLPCIFPKIMNLQPFFVKNFMIPDIPIKKYKPNRKRIYHIFKCTFDNKIKDLLKSIMTPSA